MIQINSFLCSYNFIERGIGFVIENINSEHTKAEVKIVRSVEGLNRFGIDALNK